MAWNNRADTRGRTAASSGGEGGRLRRPQGGDFAVCFLASLIMVLLALAGALTIQFADESRFEAALLARVPYAQLGTDAESIHSFARETIQYLTGAQDMWNPEMSLQGVPASQFIPHSFRTHMAGVREGVVAARRAIAAGALLALALLARGVFGGRRAGRLSFSLGGYYLGALVPLAGLAGVGAWAWLDFDGMWAWLHRTLIPDGIFSAAEPVMQLFPLELFSDYLPPVAAAFGSGVLAALALPLLLYPLSRRIANDAGERRSPTKSKR